jgi:hypothetical protein
VNTAAAEKNPKNVGGPAAPVGPTGKPK